MRKLWATKIKGFTVCNLQCTVTYYYELVLMRTAGDGVLIYEFINTAVSAYG